MKKVLATVLFACILSMPALAQNFLTMTVIESVIPGGIGRSRILINSTDGKSDEIEIKNFFSMVGINFGNIVQNDKDVMAQLKKLTAEGWKLDHVTAGVQSSSKDVAGIYVTRYLFSKP
ncbi:MAG: hypothetical protein NZ108_01125 [Bacteroidia bacterium]|nr:hypothetical protein [Bacteroidia bacterium]